MRATSSIRSISRVTSSRRSAGTVTSRPSGARSASKSSALQDLGLALERDGARRGSPARAPRAARAGARPDRAGGRRRRRSCPGATRRAAQLDHQLRGDRLRVHALLRLRAPSRSARRPRCAGRAPTSCGGCWGRSRWRPPSARASCPARPPSARRPSARRSRSAPRRPRSRPSRASSVRVWPSSVCTCSPSCARRTVSARAGDAVEVEGVQRLAGEQHHVVGDVDDVVDRPLPGGHQARLQPRRRGRDRDVLEHARGEARAEVGALDEHLGAGARGPSEPGSSLHGASRQRRAGGRVQLARDAVDAEAVGPVGRDLELEHVGGDRQHLASGVPGASSASSDLARRAPGCPPVPGPISSSASDRIMPSETTPRSFACLQLRAVGHHRARAARPRRSARRRRWARRRRSSPAPLAVAVALADIDRADPQPVGVGVLLGLSTRPTTKPSVAGTPWWWIASTLVPVIVRRSSIARTSSGGSQYSRSHGSGTLITNCSRKRRSFS